MSADRYRNLTQVVVLAFLVLVMAWAFGIGETGFGIVCAVWIVLISVAPMWSRIGHRTRIGCVAAVLLFLALAATGAMWDGETAYAVVFALFFLVSAVGAWIGFRSGWRPRGAREISRLDGVALSVPLVVAAGAVWAGQMDVALVATAALCGGSLAVLIK